MLHVWLIPVVAVIGVGVALFYLIVSFYGGSGNRTDGETLVDKKVTEEDPPKAGWNFYGKV
jgi:hypothetical protein